MEFPRVGRNALKIGVFVGCSQPNRDIGGPPTQAILAHWSIVLEAGFAARSLSRMI
jgi:hypothetical protein